jgi:hypothetical protein
MKTSAEKKFNRYTFRVMQSRPWLCALGDPEDSGWSIQICHRVSGFVPTLRDANPDVKRD